MINIKKENRRTSQTTDMSPLRKLLQVGSKHSVRSSVKSIKRKKSENTETKCKIIKHKI